MFVVKKTEFSRNFNSAKLLEEKKKEVKTWQWLTLLGCFLFQMFPYCVALNLTNVFVPTDWTIWLNGDQTLMSLTFTVGAVGAAIVGPIIARLYSTKINMRLFYGIGIFMATFGFFGSAFNAFVPYSERTKAVAATILYVSNFISQAGVMIFSGLGVNNLISKWWPPEKRGFALGIAFMGGSLGNIWMQQLVGVLAKEFGNNLGIGKNGALPPDMGGGERWVTYIILAGMGLVAGLLIVAFVCRKPVPPTEIFGANSTVKAKEIKCVGCGQEVDAQTRHSKVIEISPLVTKKYPVYWILAVGYLILQMGTVHASMNGQFIKNATAGVVGSSNDQIFNNVMAVGGTLFGIFCLIGNFGGGVLNDKIGPNKSIAIAGLGQVAAITCLMFSVKAQGLVYAYFILAGLSVYVYTSTPSYLCGRLYGPKQSNNHMSILGIFIALGFAITNSVIGTITGNVGPGQNPQTMLGEPTNGNMLGFIIFALVCMGVGTIIVVICSTIIMNKGAKGLLNYSPTKYTKIITFRHAFINKLAAKRILFFKKDYRANNKKRNEKIAAKLDKSSTYNTDLKYMQIVKKCLKDKKLSSIELQIIGYVFENELLTDKNLKNIFIRKKNIDKAIDDLVKNNYLDKKTLPNIGVYYTLSKKLLSSMTNPEINNKITKDNTWLVNKLASIQNNSVKKIAKINAKIEIENAKSIDEKKQEKYTKKSEKKLLKDQAKKQKIVAKDKNYSDWKAYKLEYAILEKIYDDKELRDKLENKKKDKLAKLNKKIMTNEFITNFNKFQEINGHNLLVSYYNNEYEHCDFLIDNLVETSIDNKILKIKKSVQNLQKKYDKELNLEEKLSINK